MREPLDAARIRRVMEALARAAERESRVYLVGGTTAVLIGWRTSTIDVDLVMHPEDPAMLRAIPALKERLRVNVEIASPADFIPVPTGWEARSPLVATIGRVAFHHFDPYAQALAKLERGHRRDLDDVRAMLERGLVDRERLLDQYERIEPELYRYPAIHAPSFRQAVERAVRGGVADAEWKERAE
jgi:hypothetical protein